MFNGLKAPFGQHELDTYWIGHSYDSFLIVNYYNLICNLNSQLNNDLRRKRVSEWEREKGIP